MYALDTDILVRTSDDYGVCGTRESDDVFTVSKIEAFSTIFSSTLENVNVPF